MKIWNKLADSAVISRYGMKKDKKHVPLRVRRMRRSGKCFTLTQEQISLTNKVSQDKQ